MALLDLRSLDETRQVGASLVTSWQVRAAVGVSRSMTWLVRSAVGRSRSLTWLVRAAVGVSRSFTWLAASAVGRSMVLTWIVAAAPKVGGGYAPSPHNVKPFTWTPLIYAVPVSASLPLGWRVRVPVASRLDWAWTVHAAPAFDDLELAALAALLPEEDLAALLAA